MVELCKKNNIEITGSIFLIELSSLTKNVEYIKEKYGQKYLKPTIIIKNLNRINEVFEYLKELNALEAIINSPYILTFNLDEIKERKAFIDSIGEPLVVGNKLNPLFGISKKRYEQRVEKIKGKTI